MAVISKVRPKRIWWLLAYAILSLALGFWGAFDYWVRIPESEKKFAQYNASTETFERLQKKSDAAPLTTDEIAEYQAAKATKESFKDGIPAPIPTYDRPLQLWVYVIGCGVLGTPWCLWAIVKLRRQRLELDGNGTLTTDTLQLDANQIQSIDMSRWMSKSIATVHGTGGERVKIDDYMMENAHLIVGRIANRFDPGAWNTDGTKWKPVEEVTEETPIESGKDATPDSQDSSHRGA